MFGVESALFILSFKSLSKLLILLLVELKTSDKVDLLVFNSICSYLSFNTLKVVFITLVLKFILYLSSFTVTLSHNERLSIIPFPSVVLD